MKTVRGLNTDAHPKNQPEGTYAFAKNFINNDRLAALQLEPGFTKYNSVVPGTAIVGIVPLGADFAVFSLDEDTSTGYIGVVSINGNSLVYEETYSSTELNFSITRPIKGEYQTNPRGERIVAWIELGGSTPPRLINLDNPNVTDIGDISLFLDYSMANVNISVPEARGALLTGSYIPIYKYKRADEAETDWIVAGRIAKINDDSLNEGTAQYDGAPAGTPTNKALTITFTNTDLGYERLIIGYIRQKGGITEAFQVQEVDNAETVTYTITGNEQTVDVTLDDVAINVGSYSNAQAITQLNNQLILGNISTTPILDFQQYANQIQVRYYHRAVTTSRTNTSVNSGAFQSGEVYALYIVLELKSGGLLAYHIPGRGPSPTDRDTDNSTVTGISAKRFQVNDTSLTGDVGNMAFWENDSEFYPADFPAGLSYTGGSESLSNQKVRHHKFPDQETIIDRHGTWSQANRLYELGLSVANVNIPEEIQSKINGWRIAYAKRNYENSLVLGNDLLHLCGGHTGDRDLLWSTGGNWNIRGATGDGDSDWRDMNIWTSAASDAANSTSYKVQRGHCADLLYDKPAVVPSYAHFQFRLNCPNLNTRYTGFNSSGGHIIRSGSGVSQTPGCVVDFAKDAAVRSELSGTKKSRIQNYQYIPQNTISGNISTKHSEEIAYMEIDNLRGIIIAHDEEGVYDDGITSGFPTWETRSSGRAPYSAGNFSKGGPLISIQSGGAREYTYYTTYKQVLSDVYLGYAKQTLVMTNQRGTPTNSTLSNIFGGDVSVNLVNYLTCSVQSPSVFNEDRSGIEHQGPRAFKSFLAETRHKWNFRYEASSQIEDLYHPKTDPRDFWSPSATASRDQQIGGGATGLIDVTTMALNKLSYNEDYDLVNDFKPALVVEDINDFVAEEPTTIIYSAVQNTDSLQSSWNTFPVNNRYTMPRNKGPITNLQGFKNRELLIHHRDSLFTTRTNVTMGTDSENVKLTTGALFDLSPDEVVSTDDGFAGCQHSLACKLTKHGYAFVDDRQGKVFLYNNQLKEISALGMRNFFRDTMNIGTEASIISTTGELMSDPELSNSGQWTQISGSDWTVANGEATFTVETGGSTQTSNSIVSNVTYVNGTPINVRMGVRKNAAFGTVATVYAKFFNNSNTLLDSERIGILVTNGTSYREIVKNDIIPPNGTTKIGFQVQSSITSDDAEFQVTYMRVTGTIQNTTTSALNNPYNDYGYNVAYDERYDRLLVSKKAESSWTVSFNPNNELWTSFHSYIPDYTFSLPGQKLLSLKDKEVYLHNVGAAGNYYEDMDVQSSFVDIVFNPEPNIDKILANVAWNTNVYDGVLPKWNETFTHITVSTENQCTGRIALTRLDGFSKFEDANVRVQNDEWFFNNLYDIASEAGFRTAITNDFNLDNSKLNSNIPWYNKGKFIDKYVICRLEYDNTVERTLLLFDQNASFRLSQR